MSDLVTQAEIASKHTVTAATGYVQYIKTIQQYLKVSSLPIGGQRCQEARRMS